MGLGIVRRLWLLLDDVGFEALQDEVFELKLHFLLGTDKVDD